MHFKLVSRPGQESLYIRGTENGVSINQSARTADRKQAKAILERLRAEAWSTGRIAGPSKSGPTFADAVLSYIDFEKRAPATTRYLEKLNAHFGDTAIADINQAAADAACKAILTPGAGPATKIRAVYTPLAAVLTHAARRGMCSVPVFDKPKVKQPARSYLTPDQVAALIEAAPEFARPLFTFLFATGARLSEALELDWSKVDLRGARATVWQKQGNERRIDLPPVCVDSLAALPHRKGQVFQYARMVKGGGWEIVGPYKDQNRDGSGQIKTVWANASQRAGLPGRLRVWKTKSGRVMEQFVPTATPHAARHTFASWHYCVHKDLLKLMHDGGWSTLSMVQKYAHMIPDVYRGEIISWQAGLPKKARRKRA